MPDLPKQDLDELFREGADMQQFEYNEAAWNKMEGMLDNDDKNRKIAIWLFFFVGTALAIMTGLYYSSLEQQIIPQEVIYATDNITSSNLSLENKGVRTEVVEEVTKVIEKEMISVDNVVFTNDIAVESKENKINASEGNNASPENSYSSGNATSKDITVSTYNDNKYLSNDPTLVLSLDTVNDELSTRTVSEYLQDNSKSELFSNRLIEVSTLQNRDVEFVNTSNKEIDNKQSEVAVAVAEYDDKNDSASLASRLSFALFVAPEWSSIGIDGPKKMGYKFGAKLGFQVSDKFELSTGLFLSQKKFNGSGSQFTIIEGWVDDIMPMTLDAKCNIIEIPLDLNYHFNGVENTGFFAGIGLRSFMLHSEWYGFEYDPLDYKPGLEEEIVTDNTQNKNWVGSLELSLGYTKKVSDNLAVQIVPYLQIPVTGIGEGKVDLYSGGVQIAVRFDEK